MSDYPAGAKNDPNAPYNEKSYGSCSTCEGHGSTCSNTGYTDCDCEEGCAFLICMDCDGTGEKTEQQAIDERESWEEDMRD